MGAAASWLPGNLESFSSSPSDVPKALRPFLQLRLDELCDLYQKFAGEEHLDVETVARELRLDQKSLQLLGKKLDAFDLLVLLVVASHTHFLTKVRFLYAMCTEEYFLDFSGFRQVVSSFLRAVWRLGSGTRKMVSASPAILDSLAFSLFRPYEPALSRDAFSKMASDDVVGSLLRRFSTGRPEHVESVVPWQIMADRRKPNEEVLVPTTTKTYIDDLDQPLPRRKGYFLAVHSARESQLYQELDEIKIERMKDGKERTRSDLDLELREKEIREELAGEVSDQAARREYRRKLQKFWHRSRPNSAVCKRHKVVCQGHLWTASSNHLARGGVLPAGVPRPITPTAVQAALNSVISSSSQPSRMIADRVLKEFQSGNKRNKSDGQKPARRASIRGKASSLVHMDDKTSEASSDVEGRCLFKKSDVLEAFKLYRSDYWLTQGGGIRSLLKSGLPVAFDPKTLTAADVAWRRKVELDLMLQEVAEEKSVLSTPEASQELTLRGFLKAVFPLAKKADIWTMMKWIKRPPNQSKAQSQKKIAKPDLGLLRDVIELFDAIDTKRTGYVPIEAVEQFLSGEIVTQGENARLNLRRQAKTNQRSVINFACYAGNPRGALILNKTLDDRPEWSVSTTGDEKISSRQSHHRNSMCRRSLEQRMDALSRALDAELYQLALGDPQLVSETIEAASNPWHHDDHLESVENEEMHTGGVKKVRLVRLYWRYMVGSAISQQMREDPSCLEVKDGKLDLTGFMCVLAQDQVNTILALSKSPPSGAQIRRLAYAFD